MFVVVLMTLIINTLIDQGPIIFLRLAEGTVGQVDAYIESESNSETATRKFTNLTQIVELYDSKYQMSPRKWQDVVYNVPTTIYSSDNISSVTGLPELESWYYVSIRFNDNKQKTVYHIDTTRESELG